MDDFIEHEYDLAGRGLELRHAGADDGDLVRRIVALAANWRAAEVVGELSADVTKYFEGWGRPSDIGVLAFRGIEFVGGASVRRFGAADGAYGYVADDIAELTIGIEHHARRQGIGVLLLAALKAKVVAAGGSGISLSVHPENGARELYERMGFRNVEDRGHDVLMVWRVGANL